MKVKHFHIRLTPDSLQKDENALNDFMQSVIVKKTVPEVVTVGQTTYWTVLVFYENYSSPDRAEKAGADNSSSVDISTLTTEEKERYEALRAWRTDVAKSKQLPSYIVASNAVLASISKLNPTAPDQLYEVKGMGDTKVNQYGDDIIAVLNSI